MPGEPAEFHTRDGLVLRDEAFGAAHAPPALLLHGGGQTHHAWKGSAESLAAAGWRAVAMDLRGHGDSDWAPDGDYRFDRYADDLLDMAGALLARPVVVGASLGGMAILMAAARAAAFPFAACVLVDITPRVRPEGVAEILGFMSAGLEDGFESIEAAAETVARYLPHRPRPVAAKGLEKNLRRGPDGRYRWHWDPKFVTGPLCVQGSADEAARVHAARCLTAPTLLVRGRLSNLVTEEDSAHFLSLVPGSRLVDVSGAGHMVAGDRNDAFTAAIVDFLEEVRAAGA